MGRYLSKSDYKLALTCPTKLYYRKAGFPTKIDDALMQDLSDAGYLVEVLVRALFPDGLMVDPDLSQEDAARETYDTLVQSDTTLFEGTFISAGKLIRSDILRRHGDTIEVIEIKSRSHAGPPQLRTRNGRIRAEWRPYLEDIGFQTLVVRELFPTLRVRSVLAILDTSRSMPVDRLSQWFHLETISVGSRGFTRQQVRVDGELDNLRDKLPVQLIDVTSEVDELMPALIRNTDLFIASLNPLQSIASPLTPACQHCEFRYDADPSRSGFHQCWGDLATAQPHILDLHRATDQRTFPILQKMIAAGVAGLLDLPAEHVSALTPRQSRQIQAVRDNQSWFSPSLRQEMDRLAYPLHFVDFETARFGLPSYAGLPPYAIEAFQWSCHTMAAPDGPIEHATWLCSDASYPNANFAATLLAHLGTHGTILTWTSHEITTLRAVAEQLALLQPHQADLIQAIETLLASQRIIDLHEITLHHFVHPAAGPSTSLKQIVEAVWLDDADGRETFAKTFGLDPCQGFYASLPQHVIGGKPAYVRHGAAAQNVYRILQHPHLDLGDREAWAELLRLYCCRDTLAMVLVWEYWKKFA